MKKNKKGRSFTEAFDKKFGTLEFFDKGEALRIANEIIMEDKDAKMRAAQEKLRETREANRLAAQRMLEEESAKKRWVRPEMPQEPIATEKVAAVPSEVVPSPEIDEKTRNMMIAIEILREKRKTMPPVPREKRTR